MDRWNHTVLSMLAMFEMFEMFARFASLFSSSASFNYFICAYLKEF